MRKQAIAIVLGLWLLVAGAVFLHAGIPAPPDKAVTRMAELGLVLLDGEEGVSVLAVRNRSTADRAGILPGDVLLQADGIALPTSSSWNRCCRPRTRVCSFVSSATTTS